LAANALSVHQPCQFESLRFSLNGRSVDAQ